MPAKGVRSLRAFLWVLLLLLAPVTGLAAPCELGIYTYDSIAGQGGLGARIFPRFERETGCKIRVLASGDAVQTLGRAEIDLKRGKPEGDIILGVDNLLWERVQPIAARQIVVPAGKTRLVPLIRASLRRFPGMVPYDFGALSLTVDEKQLGPAGIAGPISLKDLLEPRWRRALILEDPRTSSPGLQFLLFTRSVLGNRFAEYWRSLRSQWLTMPEGWGAAYGLFLKGQAPLVWSYVTSQAYHHDPRYRALLFKEGQPVQIEGAIEVRGAAHAALAGRFLRFLLSPEVQDQVALTNWMEPVIEGAKVPRGFAGLPKSVKNRVLSGKDASAVLREWSEAIHR